MNIIIEFLTKHKKEFLGKKRTRIALRKRQAKWQEIHLFLVEKGFISPLKKWTSTRYVWYRMAARAKVYYIYIFLQPYILFISSVRNKDP